MLHAAAAHPARPYEGYMAHHAVQSSRPGESLDDAMQPGRQVPDVGKLTWNLCEARSTVQHAFVDAPRQG
jgi:hypothetical protein